MLDLSTKEYKTFRTEWMFHTVGFWRMNSSSSAENIKIREYTVAQMYERKGTHQIFCAGSSEREQRTEIGRQIHQLFPKAIDEEAQEPLGF